MDGLGRYTVAGRIAAAYERLISLQIAGDHAEELAGQDYITGDLGDDTITSSSDLADLLINGDLDAMHTIEPATIGAIMAAVER